MARGGRRQGPADAARRRRRAAPPAARRPRATSSQLGAKDTKFSTDALTAPADQPFTIHFTNDDTIPHNVHIKDASGAVVFNGDLFTGPGATDYQVPALKAGTYPFVCIVHPNMTGTLTVQ